MNVLLLIVVVVGVTLQNVAKKEYSVKVQGGPYAFNFATVATALIGCVLGAGGKLDFSATVVPYALLFSLVFCCSAVFSLLAIAEGPLSITALISSYSLLIPTFWGLIVWNEPFSMSQALGLVILMASLFMINYKKNNGKVSSNKKMTKKWYLYVALAFVGSGLCSVVQKMQQLACDGLYKNEFMAIGYLSSAIVMLSFSLYFERKSIYKNIKNSCIWWISGGIANVIVNLLVMKLSNSLPASLMFPVISGGGILATVLVSLLIYKEKLAKEEKLGIVLGIIALVALNI